MTKIYEIQGKSINVVAPPVGPMGLDGLVLPMYLDLCMIGVMSQDPTILQIGVESQSLDDDILNLTFEYRGRFEKEFGKPVQGDYVLPKSAHEIQSRKGRIARHLIYMVPVDIGASGPYCDNNVLFEAFSSAFRVAEAMNMTRIGIVDTNLMVFKIGADDYLGIAALAAKARFTASEKPSNISEVNLITVDSGKAQSIAKTYMTSH